MIDIDKIEAAARAATPGDWWWDTFEHPDGHALAWIGNAFVDCAGGQKNYADPTQDANHIATANPATVLEMVSMIRERDAVLKQALVALSRTEMYLCIEVNEAYGRDAHVSTINEWQEKLAHHKGAIAAIKGILNE